MTIFFVLVSLVLIAGVAVMASLLSKQATKVDAMASEARNAAAALAQCREVGAEMKSKADADIKRLREEAGRLEAAYRDLKAKAETQIRGLMSKFSSEQSRAAGLEKSLAEQAVRLTRWQGILDAEVEARRIVAEAHAQAETLNQQAAQRLAEAEVQAKEAAQQASELIAQANRDASDVTAASKLQAEQAKARCDGIAAEARREAEELKAAARGLIEEARVKAEQIVAAAEKKSSEIAGEAWEIKKNTEKYQQTLKAIKNEIEGYGDAYIVPAHSLLDDLADDVGYSEAGQQLKAVRARLKQMVKGGLAAKCDYAEANRRETAIRFVTDAFNGKVDSILTRVKADNAGTLQQQIKDAFFLVNGNGEAFRSARITEEYLAARLEELKWACIAHAIKKEEQEEQRRIKERIREDEKAKREYERAIKAAAKEEDAMRKAEAKVREQMEKAAAEERERLARASTEERLVLEQASAEQRAKYEAELAEIRAKMQEIEERGQRAMSMAQQTKKGNVYIISNMGSFGEHVYKIGLTRRLDPHERIRELGDSSVPFEFDVHALIEAEDAPALEHRLHKHFVLHQVNKVNHRKEFFRCDLAKIREEVESLGLAATWTMAAAARDYRETLAIEKRIAEDPLAKQRWIDRQLELEDLEDVTSMELVASAVGEDGEEDES
jgi:F0F1-type ATP synthase membrane subunit b/b'